MKTISRNLIAIEILVILASLIGGCSGPVTNGDSGNPRLDPTQVAIVSPPSISKPPFTFGPDDQLLLDEIEHATFTFFWEAVAPETGMVYDRTSSDVISVAGVGFQLASLPIGVERGWISRTQGHDRALKILHALDQEPTNRKAGLFYHFINPHDASARRVGRELVVSTVDSAILFAGMLTAGQYFHGAVADVADRLYTQADWTFFLSPPGEVAPPGSFLSLGWKPKKDADPIGSGTLLPYYWIDSGDEQRLTTFLALSSPKAERRIPASVYWNLRRQLGIHNGQPVVWFPYSGALFTNFFAHCFIDYAHLPVDAPEAHGATIRARVNWWENSRRMVQLHRDRALENPKQLPTLGPDAWGLSACDGPNGYLVPGLFPKPVEMIGAKPERDFATYQPVENWGSGIVPPYAAGASIMFEPQLAVRALRHYRSVRTRAGNPGPWAGRWGFVDAFRLDETGAVDWTAKDFVAISQGPLLLGIENARTGLIWRLFMAHPAVDEGVKSLHLK